MHSYTIVDAFAGVPLEGNPVAVFFDSDDLSADLMQRIAQEMHLSETTFVLRPKRSGDVRVRIFTPVNELPFAGHPLLGTAVALHKVLKKDHLLLETVVADVPFELTDPGDDVLTAWMQQPIPTWQPYELTDELLAALGIKMSTAPVEIYRNGPRHVFVGIESIAELSALRPDHSALTQFPDVAVNCFAGRGNQWRTRMFSPAYGVVEDAATGSAAGPLAIHLARHGFTGGGQVLHIRQGVELGRPSLMHARLTGPAGRPDTVRVGGQAVIVGCGLLYV